MSIRRDDAPPRTSGRSLEAVLAAGVARQCAPTGVKMFRRADAGMKQAKVEEEEEEEQTPAAILGLPKEIWMSMWENIDTLDICNQMAAMCKTGGVPEWKELCGEESTYDALNKKLGFYGKRGTLDAVRTWYVDLGRLFQKTVSPERNTNARMQTLTAKDHFADICYDRVEFQKRWRLCYRQAHPTNQHKIDLRVMINHMTFPGQAPHAQAQAIYLVGVISEYLEFIPGSVLLSDRNEMYDLTLPEEHDLRRTHSNFYVKRNPDNPIDDYPAVAIKAINDWSGNFEYVPGSINKLNGVQKLFPCEQFAKIAKFAVEKSGDVLAEIPGSQLNPERVQVEPQLPPTNPPIMPVENYAELAIIASKTAWYSLRVVPGSINPHTGTQLRAPIDRYYEIAEAYVRDFGMAIAFVPGSINPDAKRLSGMDPIGGYAELAKIAVEKAPRSLRYMPPQIAQLPDIQKIHAASKAKKDAESAERMRLYRQRNAKAIEEARRQSEAAGGSKDDQDDAALEAESRVAMASAKARRDKALARALW